MKALYWTDENGETIMEKEIPAASMTEAHEYRVKLMETLAENDEMFFEIFMDTEQTVTVEILSEAIKGSAAPDQLFLFFVAQPLKIRNPASS